MINRSELQLYIDNPALLHLPETSKFFWTEEEADSYIKENCIFDTQTFTKKQYMVVLDDASEKELSERTKNQNEYIEKTKKTQIEKYDSILTEDSTFEYLKNIFITKTLTYFVDIFDDEEKIRRIEIEEKSKIFKRNIEEGCIYFKCESLPISKDDKTIYANPVSKDGSFRLINQLDNSLFSSIKEFGRYYDKEFLDDMDMFYSDSGWRFGKQAIETLLQNGKRVFVDNEEVIL